MSHLSNLSWVMSDTEDWWKKGEREQTSQREKGWTRTNKSKREQLTVQKSPGKCTLYECMQNAVISWDFGTDYFLQIWWIK